MDKFKVLVVDDEQDFLETLVNRLNKRDIDTHGAASGEESLKLMKDIQFDAVVLDIKMPGGLAFEKKDLHSHKIRNLKIKELLR